MLNPIVRMRDPDALYLVRFYGDYRHQIDVRAKNAALRSGVDGFEAVTGSWPAVFYGLVESSTGHRLGHLWNVAPNYFSVLGINAIKGRVLAESDIGVTPPAVVIGERTARDLFSKSDPIGQHIEIQGETFTVIGVIDHAADQPLSGTAAWRLPPANVDLASLPLTIARVRPGVPIEHVEQQLRVIADRIALQAGESSRDDRVAVGKMIHRQFHVGGFHYALIGAVIAVLLVACGNIANLQLARGIARSRELATRAALGASRRDLVTHLVLESAMIAGAGLVLGLALTFWGMGAIRASMPPNIGEFIVEPQTSWRLFAFAALATVVCVLLVGLAPAIRVSRVNLNELIKNGAGTGSTRAARRQYGLIIAAEIGFALVVVCGAALLVRASLRVEANIRALNQSMLAGAVTRVDIPDGQSLAFADIGAELTTRLRNQPDVADAAVTWTVR
ncbi:MAG: ABC transporter permease, partial [Solirubrobacteraceae bacterium]